MAAVQKQIQLPLSKAVSIAVASLRVRLGRSLLTLLTIIMAIAFLTNIWASRVFEPPMRAAKLAAQGLADVASIEAGGGTSRLVWLISLSLLVCTVGITNAMLMSVMERFREIGTMKCLGALDSFILKLFLIESFLLGLAGSLAGALLGQVVTIALLARNYHGHVFANLPWGSAWLILLASTAIGMTITALAALYPALKAAKMQPIAAMRVEV